MDELLDALDVLRLVDGGALRDDARVGEVGEVAVHGVHAEVATGLHRGRDLERLALADEVGDGGRCDEHLGGDDSTLATGLLHERLADDTAKGRRELRSHLALLVRREDVDNTVDGLRRILRVQGGEDEVAGFCRGQRDGDGLEVSKLTDQDDVGVLPQDVLESGAEQCVSSPTSRWLTSDFWLPCRNSIGSSTVMMWSARVLFTRSMSAASVVDLPEPVGPVTSTRPRGKRGELRHRLGNAEVDERLDLGRDESEGCTDRATLLVHVDAEAGVRRNRVRDVELELLVESLGLASR